MMSVWVCRLISDSHLCLRTRGKFAGRTACRRFTDDVGEVGTLTTVRREVSAVSSQPSASSRAHDAQSRHARKVGRARVAAGAHTKEGQPDDAVNSEGGEGGAHSLLPPTTPTLPAWPLCSSGERGGMRRLQRAMCCWRASEPRGQFGGELCAGVE